MSGEKLTRRGEHKQEQETGDARFVCRGSCRGSFVRTFHLTGEVDVENVEVRLKAGNLALPLPKLHTEQHRHIEVSEE